MNFIFEDFCTDGDAVSFNDGHLRLEVKAEVGSCYEAVSAEFVERKYKSGSIDGFNRFCFTGGL